MFMQKNSSEVRRPKQCIRVPKHPFCFDFRAVGIQMIRNTPNHHLGPKRVDWRCPLRKTHSEVRYPEAVHPGTETEPFHSVLHAEGTETLHINPKHRFGSNGGYRVCLREKIHMKFGGRNSAFGDRNTRFASIFVQYVSKCSETLPNII